MSDPIVPRRLRFRFSLRMLLLVVAGMAILCGSWVGYRRWYIATHPVEVMFEKMHRSIRNGDSISDLEKHLGPGYPLKRDEVPTSNRDLYEDGDEFVRWKIENWTLYLQFRDGRLINHNPAEFAESPVMHGLWQQ